MPIERRKFLKAAGVTMALPWLEALAPRRARGETAATLPRRMVCICLPLGLHSPDFVPAATGKDYPLSPYLTPLAELRNDFTVISGLSHPSVGPTHDSIYSFLTGAPNPELRAGFRNSISLDQFAAERWVGETRHDSLVLSCEGFSLSWTQSGAIVPSDSFPSSVFTRLFIEDKPEAALAQTRRLQDGRSVLDAVSERSKALQPKLGARDREKLDEYYTSVRELEQRLARAEVWSGRSKPVVSATVPQDIADSADLVGRARLMFDLIHLALETDSTRLATLLLLGTSLVPPVPGVSLGHHDLSHHGQDPAKIAQLKLVEMEAMTVFAQFLGKLAQTKEQDQSLLDRTSVFFSSNLGNASNHSTKNLPVILAGGGFRHGQHLAFDADNPPPLSNLYLSMLHRSGIEAERFSSSTGALAGLEFGPG